MEEWLRQMNQDLAIYEQVDDTATKKFADLRTPEKVELGIKTRLQL